MRISDWSSDVCSSDLGLAADQRASGLLAPFGDARDDFGRDIVVELARRIIIEEKQRLGALHDQIVRTHRDQVDPDPVMFARFDRKLQLGADAVVRRNEQGVVEPRRLQVEKAAKTARSEEQPSELQSLMHTSYAVVLLNKNTRTTNKH